MNLYSLTGKISDPNMKTTNLGGDEVYRIIPRARWNNRDYIYQHALITSQKMIDPDILDERYFFECITTHRNPEFGHDWILLDIYFLSGDGSFIGFICNEKVMDVLKEFILPKQYQFLRTRLLYQGDYLEYYIFQYICQNPLSNFIENNKMVYKDNLNKIYPNQFNSSELYIKYKGLGYKNHPEATMLIELRKFQDLMYDDVTKGTVISPRLKEALEDAKVLSGAQLKLVEHVNFQFADMPDDFDN